jgi:SAM-dependent methyltransferase
MRATAVDAIMSRELGRLQRRYRFLAPIYESTLGERLLYERARRRAVDMLGLVAGATVVDVACGTGLNFPLIQERIGPSGTLIGVDMARRMLKRADERVQKAGWPNVKLVQLDAMSLTCERLERMGALPLGTPVDAAVCTLGMSVIPEWERAWEAMVALVRPGGAVALMDGSPPIKETATTRLTRPLVWLGCRFFAADWTRRPWQLVERDVANAEIVWSRSGYVNAAGGHKGHDDTRHATVRTSDLHEA